MFLSLRPIQKIPINQDVEIGRAASLEQVFVYVDRSTEPGMAPVPIRSRTAQTTTHANALTQGVITCVEPPLVTVRSGCMESRVCATLADDLRVALESRFVCGWRP